MSFFSRNIIASRLHSWVPNLHFMSQILLWLKINPLDSCLSGMLVSVMREIILSVTTCHILSWIHMKSAENLHICSYLTLDRFDSGGPGSCLKRYSDPTFFRRASSYSEESNSDKSQRERKARKIKKRRSLQRSDQFPKSASILNSSGRMQFSSAGHGKSSLLHTGSTFDMIVKSDLGDQSDSRGTTDGMDFIDCVSRPSISTHSDVTKNKMLSSSVMEAEVNMNGSIHLNVTAIASVDEPCSHAVEATIARSTSATWDEKLEMIQQTPDVCYEIEDIHQVMVTNSSIHEKKFILVNEKGVNQANDFPECESSPKLKSDEWLQSTCRDGNSVAPTGLSCGIINEIQDSLKTKADHQHRYMVPIHPKSSSQAVGLSEGGKPLAFLHEQEFKLVNEKGVNRVNDLSECGSSPKSKADDWFLRISREKKIMASIGLNCGVINEVQDSLKTKLDLQQHYLGIDDPKSCSQLLELSEGGKLPELTTNGNFINNSVYRNLGAGEAQFLLEADFDVAENELERSDTEDVGAVDGFTEGGNSVKAIEWNQKKSETVSADHDCQEEAKVIEWSQQGLETVILDNLGDAFSEGRRNVKVIEWSQLESGSIYAEHVYHEEAIAEGGSSLKLIKWNQQELEKPDAEDVSHMDMLIKDRNSVQVIEWNQLDEIDSGKENFVDALNTIESESESDFESEMRKEVQAIVSNDEMEDTAVNCQLRVPTNLEPVPQCSITFNDCKERGLEDLGSSITFASLTNMPFPDYTQISHDISDSAEGQQLDVACCSFQEESMHASQTPDSSNIPLGLNFCANDPERGVQPECEIRSMASASPTNMGSFDHTQLSCDHESESSLDQKLDVSTSLFEKQPVQISTTETFSNFPLGIDFCARDPATRVETAVFKIVKSGSEVPNDEEIIASPRVSRKILLDYPPHTQLHSGQMGLF